MPRTLILFIGNPIFSDDSLPIILGRRLSRELREKGLNGVDVEVVEATGAPLVDYLAGYDKVVVVDTMKTGELPPGEVVLLRGDELAAFYAPSLHGMGLPEALALLRVVDQAPKEIYVIGIEVKDPYTLSEDLSDAIASKLDEIYDRVRSLIYGVIRPPEDPH